MIADAETHIQENKLYSDCKHIMAVNRAFAIGILKDMLMAALIADSNQERDTILAQMLDDIKAEVLPVRRNRHFKRTKGVLAGKYHNNRKRVF
jgi:hypothetical protein